tara:strand:+ start:32894 stop:33241 length:348 start_codon:yes stop_codon:yes gene_type:complete
MTTKEELIEHIRSWVTTENKIKQLRSELKQLNQSKKTISNDLIEIMKQNDIDAIDMNEGKLLYKKSIVKSPISKKHLIACLETFYKNDTEIVNELTSHILDTRESKIYESIKHKN